jgi:secondary thiamine-phosphate synthase enzyme
LEVPIPPLWFLDASADSQLRDSPGDIAVYPPLARFIRLKRAGVTTFNEFIISKEVQVKSYRKELWFEVPTRRAFINITPKVEECLRESGIREGLLLCNAMHITASVFINDDESGLHHDYDVWLEKLAPHEPVSHYRHNVGEDNADAHMKRQIMGREVVVAVTGGKLDFGTWERIFYGEFDGRRRKRVLVKIIGE